MCVCAEGVSRKAITIFRADVRGNSRWNLTSDGTSKEFQERNTPPRKTVSVCVCVCVRACARLSVSVCISVCMSVCE